MILTAEQVLTRYRAAALSHESAAVALGLDLPDPPSLGYLTIARNQSRLRLPGWVVTRVDLPKEDLTTLGEARVTTPPRTVVDLSRRRSLDVGVVAADSAIRLGWMSQGSLRDALESASGPGSARCRKVAAAIDPRSGSALETLLRLVFVEAGLLGFTTQEVIRDRGRDFVARVDFCWRANRLVVEADGFAFHSDRAAYRQDRQRMNDLERLGWRVLRFTYEDVRSRPDYVVAIMRACLADLAA